MTNILEITDGTDKIDLINIKNNGFCVKEEYRFSIPSIKGGGTFQDSSLADGRRIVNSKFENPVSVYPVIVSDNEQDNVIENISTLIRLLEKGRNYWTSEWASSPVWIKRKAACETNPQYARIINYQIQELGNPHFGPFYNEIGQPTFPDVTISIEHERWLSNEPGSTTGIYLDRGQADNSPVTVDATTGPVHISSYRSDYQIDSIYYWDNSTSTWSSNLIGTLATGSSVLLPANPTTNDFVLFGISSASIDAPVAMRIYSLVFNLTTASDAATGNFLYNNGGGAGADNPLTDWAVLTPEVDETNDLQNTGKNVVLFTNTDGIDATDPAVGANPALGVTGFWIAWRPTAAITVQPVQDGPLYRVTSPFVDISEDNAQGDIDPLLQYILTGKSSSAGALDTYDKLLIGIRSLDRGEIRVFWDIARNFTSIDVVNAAAIEANFAKDGVGLIWSPAAPFASFEEVFTITLTGSAYVGRYRMYLRSVYSSGTNIQIRYELDSPASGGSYFVGEELDYQEFLELGDLVITEQMVTGSVKLVIRANMDTAATVLFLDLVLFPIDEYSYYVDFTGDIDTDYALTLSSLGKNSIDTTFVDDTGEATGPVIALSNDIASFQSNSNQRIYVLPFSNEVRVVSTIELGGGVRYLGLRGNG